MPRYMTTMDTLAALGGSICATGAGAASHVEAPARHAGSSASKSGERERKLSWHY